MGRYEIELAEQLKEAGILLLNPPSSVDELLHLLDNMECLLRKVDQMPSRSMQDALLPSMKALISSTLLRQSNEDVKFSVASCISEIARITAPEIPYSDEQMKEIFGLIVTATEKLSQMSGHFYAKAVSMLDTIAKVRLCLVMLDLELDELVLEMFQRFLEVIRPNHPNAVFSAMKAIMTLVINESEEISLDLLNILLGSVRIGNQGVSPIALKLAEKVMTNCSAKLKPYLKRKVQSTGIAVDHYAPVVGSICQTECCSVDTHVSTNGSCKDALSPPEKCPSVDDICILDSKNRTSSTENFDGRIYGNSSKLLAHCSLTQQSEKEGVQGIAETEIKKEMELETTQMELETTKRKRGWKPNFFKNPDEGYDHSWICKGRKAGKLLREEKLQDKGRDNSPLDNLVAKEVAAPMIQDGIREVTSLSRKCSEILNAHSSSQAQQLPGISNVNAGQSREHTDTSALSVSRETITDSQLERGLISVSDEVMHVSSTIQIQRLFRGGHVKKRGLKKPNYPSSSSILSGNISSAQHEDGTMASSDVSLKKQSKKRENLESAQQKHSVIVALSAKSDRKRKKTLALPKVENVVLSEAEEKLVDRAVEMGVQKIKSDGSSARKHAKKRNVMDDSSDGNAALTFGCKDNLNFNRVGNSQAKTPKSVVKRKHTSRKEVDSENADLGDELIGHKIKVWWPLDKRFYDGVVDSYDHIKKKHKILYVDGDEETLNLRKQRWKLMTGGTSPNKGIKSGLLQEPDTSGDILRKQTGKAKAKVKPESLIKRRSKQSLESADAGICKIETEHVDIDKPDKLSSKSKDDGKEPGIVNKPAIKLKILGPNPVTPPKYGESQKFKITGPKLTGPPEDGQMEKRKQSVEAASDL